MQTAVVLKRHFPSFEQMLSDLPDGRKRPQYEVKELAMAVVAMFLYKRGSRNNADNTADKINYKKNIEHVFNMRLPNLDTSNRLMKGLAPDKLEAIKKEMVSILIKRKVFYKFRVMDLYYNVAIDGTGVHSYKYEPYPECPYKEYKSGKKIWTAMVLEAKIVCSNGFSISIATEWIKNPADKEFDKQDSELKAFVRLAASIKKLYPRLPVVITADGLYPNNTVFNICKNNNWKYIITLKDGNLTTVWQEIGFLDRINDNIKDKKFTREPNLLITEDYKGFQNIEYQKHKLNIVEARVKKKPLKSEEGASDKRFAHVTNFSLSKQKLQEISYSGRMRWKIENEGFKEQKNTGYNLQHKYSRKSFIATQNYYQCLQIAHIINQLSYKSTTMNQLIKGNDTWASWEEMVLAVLMVDDLETQTNLTAQILNNNYQLRY
jgi:hypothetical protein